MTSAGNVLVVDDEHSIRRLLRMYLEREGFSVLEADNGLDGLSLLRRRDVDIALVDVMLPGVDGFELVRRIRAESDVPVILLTARGEETKRVAGLEIGADDYVVKPFSVPELVARVRAQLRRSTVRETDDGPLTASEGRLILDPTSRRVLVNGDEVKLTRREFDLLQMLLRSRGRANTRARLLETVWGSTYMSTKTVDVHVAGLRRKLGDSAQISTLRGVGYRMESDV